MPRRLVVLILLALTLAPRLAKGRDEAPIRLPQELTAHLDDSVFEVVIPRGKDDFVTYAHNARLPVEELPFKDRSDKFYGVGTAFATAPDTFVSAAHVFQLDLYSVDHEYYLRDKRGEVHAVATVKRYSQYRDLIEFTLKTTPKDLAPLKLQPATALGEPVYTVGDAFGEGIAVRDGQISSYTFEPVAGAWKDLRFSAAASPGNSGGPLLNTRGEVVGVVVRKNENENLNVATPIAELEHTAAGTADFFVASVEANVDGEPVADWKFSMPLPSTLDVLGRGAEASRRQFHLAQWRIAMAATAKTSFPVDPALGDYVRDQSYAERIQTLSFDAKTGYALTPEGALFERKTAHGETVAGMVEESDYDLAEIELPAGADPATYLQKPELLLDAVVEAYAKSREFNGRHIQLQSFGPAQSRGTFVDALGRSWLKAAWHTWYNEGSLLLNCLPGPSAFGCLVDDIASSDETFGLQEKLEAYYANLHPMSYRGTPADWRRFLALGDVWVPKALHGLTLGGDKGKVAFSGGDFKIAYRQPLASEASSLFVGVGYGLRDVKELEIHSVEFDHGADLKVVELFDLYLEPPPAPKTGVGSDGYVRHRLGKTVALAGGRRIVETVACRGAGRRPSATVLALCSAIAKGR